MKKILASAVAAAVFAPAIAMASGPTLYGKIHMSIDHSDNHGTGTGNYDEWSLNDNSSRIGVKGSEDLGNGLTVGYLIEWGTEMDNGGDTFTARNRAITLSGDWGTALAGVWTDPLSGLRGSVDLFGDRIGDLRNIVDMSTDESRYPNVVAYVTPNMNGLTATVAYVFDHTAASGIGLDGDISTMGMTNGIGAEGSDDNSDDDAFAANLVYKNGPLMLGAAYRHVDVDGTQKALRSVTGDTTAAADLTRGLTETDAAFAARVAALDAAAVAAGVATANAISDIQTWRVVGSYEFGDFKVLGSYTDENNYNGVKAMDADAWSLGAQYKMGNNTLKVQYADRDIDVSGGANDHDADMWVIGVDHTMSKRTTVYVAYAAVDNNSNDTACNTNGTLAQRLAPSACRAYNSGHDGQHTSGIAAGDDSDAFSVGIIHQF